jgi:hypothetical protein
MLGTRPAGMAGAFVAVADDASAVYWNPAALASGSYFSLVLDQNSGEGQVPLELRGVSRSASLIALGTPPLGLSYYRLRSTGVEPSMAAAPGGSAAVSSLVTHHIGVTLVQSLTDWMAVGTTLKLVRGVAGRGLASGNDLDELFDAVDDLPSSDENEFDADIGVLATRGALRVGVTLRNVAEPEFDTPGGTEPVKLDRQSRAGVAYAVPGGLLVAADVDLERVSSELGATRNLAFGAEARILTKAFIRSGFRFNTIGQQPGGRAPVVSLGGSYAALGSLLVDGQITWGSEAGARGWGVAGRVLF